MSCFYLFDEKSPFKNLCHHLELLSCIQTKALCLFPTMLTIVNISCAGDGAKAVAKRKLQQGKLGSSKARQEQPAQAPAEASGSNEPEAASPVVLPKVSTINHVQLV